MIDIIDLQFQEHGGTIAAFLVPTAAGPVLVEPGPATTWNALKEGVRRAGYAITEVEHVFLTHIHLDHAGAAWRLAEHGATVHVHPAGAGHLADPSALWKSAQRLFQDTMGRLWGEMRAIASSRIHSCEDGETVEIGGRQFVALHTPGHARHHIAWQLGADTVFAGDAAGVSLRGGPVVPTCPPPDIDLDAWRCSIDRLRKLQSSHIYLTHFGLVRDTAVHLSELEKVLRDWSQWMGAHLDGTPIAELIPRFESFVRAGYRAWGLNESEIADYELASPSFMSVPGLARYLNKRCPADL